MAERVAADLFAEDRAHEQFLVPLVRRLAGEEGVPLELRVLSARGGHSQAMREFRLYQKVARMQACPAALLVVGIDTNCSSFPEVRREVREAAGGPFRDRVVAACPDPHIERWYLADPQSFRSIVGRGPGTVDKGKCAQDHYKRILHSAIREAGHPVSNVKEFAPRIAVEMDLYRAGKADPALKAFVDDCRSSLKRLRISAP